MTKPMFDESKNVFGPGYVDVPVIGKEKEGQYVRVLLLGKACLQNDFKNEAPPKEKIKRKPPAPSPPET